MDEKPTNGAKRKKSQYESYLKKIKIAKIFNSTEWEMEQLVFGK